MPARRVSGVDRPLAYAGAVVVVAGAYYLAGRIGLELAYLDGAVAALWPPAGFGLAILFLLGIRLWPAIVVGDLLLGDYSTPADPARGTGLRGLADRLEALDGRLDVESPAAGGTRISAEIPCA